MTPSDPRQLAPVLEAILLAAGRPLSLAALGELFDDAERPSAQQLREALGVLGGSCLGRGCELVEVASGYRLQVRARFAPWVSRLWEERPARYSRALLETLALIAYRQPVTRGEIEEVRGVAVNSNIIRTLQERDWIRVVGHREVPGRPALLATTRQFLDDFNLKSLEELPPLSALRELEPRGPLSDEDDDRPVPAALQARADLALAESAEREPPAPEAPEAPSFRSLLAELDAMEQGLKSDFDDLLPDEPPPEAP
ncbi:SMC-Scp complex subunit ScpB [Pseudomonas sp. NW5]|uniref:SMC-Scp complex subunit ScpB n=1 Tax=Pseudomonas sp. NW5 TaxID=2934934 RepID=UPI0020220104|nr:SMC-Scp complex subunit ScpB [Pseudomonas sp. NW5]MCL7462050.1 SMC-Scp complex subunit ScpB [Pseudomonas sp. NW5]